MKTLAIAVTCAACSAGPFPNTSVDAAQVAIDAAQPQGLQPIQPMDFGHVLDKAYIRAPQTWIGDAAFEAKWTTMLTSPTEFLGGADSAFHEDLGSLARPLPGGEVLCHGDAKLDNFGWVEAGGPGELSDLDFDDAGACPAAADILHFLVATDLLLGNAALDDQALAAYVDTVASDAAATMLDPSTLPVWADVRSTGVDKKTSHSLIKLGGEVQAATPEEIDAVTALATADARFPRTILDITRDVHVDGGSAGLRRFWVLVEDATHPRTIIELKELATPGTELGPHTTTYDGATRFDTLKAYWWGAPVPGDHFGVTLLNARFLARDKYTRVTPDPTTMTAPQIANLIEAEASLMAHKHRAAWSQLDSATLRSWLAASAATLTARWRAAYASEL
jgi:hypothetical protein